MTAGWTHSASGYQNHGCRCAVCKNAWAMKYRELNRQRYHDRKLRVEPVNTLTSWWTEAPRANFTALVERDHLERMHTNTLGKGRGRSISTEELER